MDMGLGGQPHTWPEIWVLQSQTFLKPNFLMKKIFLKIPKTVRILVQPQTPDNKEIEARFCCFRIPIKSTTKHATGVITESPTQKKLFSHQNWKLLGLKGIFTKNRCFLGFGTDFAANVTFSRCSMSQKRVYQCCSPMLGDFKKNSALPQLLMVHKIFRGQNCCQSDIFSY